MPPTLHPHLKQGLDFDGYRADSEDVVEDAPVEYCDPEDRAAKRRRVAAIAAQYLQGKLPVILSAGLRGPFHDWKNPWTQNTGARKKMSAKTGATTGARRRPSANNTAEGSSIAKAMPRTKRGATKRPVLPQVSSPEASRAVADDLDIHEQDSSLDNIEVPPAIAPLSEEAAAPSATKFSSSNTQKRILNRSPMTNPFWLRRPESEKTGGRGRSINNYLEESPTRSRARKGLSKTIARSQVQIALPKSPLHNRRSQKRVQDNWRSSASASMVISSPLEMDENLAILVDAQTQPMLSISENTATLDSGSNPPVTHVITPKVNNQPSNVTQSGLEGSNQMQRVMLYETHQQDSEGLLTATITEMDQPTDEPKDISNDLVTSSFESKRPVSREDIQQSRKRLTKLMPSSSAPSRHPSRSNGQIRPQNSLFRKPLYNLVASPAPASSTGFVYRKFGDPESNTDSSLQSKTRLMNSTLAPSIKEIAGRAQSSPPGTSFIHENEAIPTCLPQQTISEKEGPSAQDPYEHGIEEKDVHQEKEQQQHRSSRPSRDSAYSTQAVFQLAQLAFNESTCLSVGSETPCAWSQPERDTPRLLSSQPTLAKTPYSTLVDQLEKRLPNSVLREPLMSTQDQINAASPFDWSTIKRKPEGPQRSSLRFALFSDEQEQSMVKKGTTMKSPTPSAGRIPLKAKNTTMLLWSFSTEKASQISDESMVGRSRRPVSDVESPQIDFDTSLSNLGPNSLHFTDRFLRRLDNS